MIRTRSVVAVRGDGAAGEINMTALVKTDRTEIAPIFHIDYDTRAAYGTARIRKHGCGAADSDMSTVRRDRDVAAAGRACRRLVRTLTYLRHHLRARASRQHQCECREHAALRLSRAQQQRRCRTDLMAEINVTTIPRTGSRRPRNAKRDHASPQFAQRRSVCGASVRSRRQKRESENKHNLDERPRKK